MRKFAALGTTVLLVGLGFVSAPVASAAQSGGVCSNFTTSEPMLRYGDSGLAVQALQCELNRTIRWANLDVDGVFGQKTYNAVIEFQGKDCMDIDTDGIVGPITWNLLDRWSNSARFIC
ncbi:peptidoglycan-binding protein [Streptomyces sp. NPDC089919]|uniref:peptidoglycan-binding domain-containing protein n=1 Tax=Streptomyces sp. NPDC089919 TaxID=3155188 RepID=UPI0034147FA2